MKELFKITESHDVELNKEWMFLVPEFRAVIAADKGSKGDADGRKKLKARKQFGYIYFMYDFRSPIEQWDYAKKHAEALRYTDLTEQDVTTALLRAAAETFQVIQHEAARALKTLASVRKALDALDAYYENLDFTQVDKQGKLLHNPKEIPNSIATLNKMFDEVDKFEKRVREQLKESTTIRGQASLGDKEHKRHGGETWDEGTNPVTQSGKRFDDLSVVLNETKTKEE